MVCRDKKILLEIEREIFVNSTALELRQISETGEHGKEFSDTLKNRVREFVENSRKISKCK